MNNTQKQKYYTIAEYCDLKDVFADDWIVSHLDWKASRICKNTRYKVIREIDPQGKNVRTYPRAVLIKAFEGTPF